MNFAKFFALAKEAGIQESQLSIGKSSATSITLFHHEIENFCNMVEFFHEFLCQQELLDENGDLDMDQLHCIADAMAKSYDEEEDEQ